ncbi:TraG family conjugation protein, partial [Enterococcus faecium]
IDNLSRAEKQSSMVVNVPKTELFVGSKDVLEARGYDVYAFNITDPLQSMSDYPLALIVKYWKRGDIDTATQLSYSFTNTIYYD